MVAEIKSGSLRVITDFDGPIMDLSERYYQVYRFCLAQFQPPAAKPAARARQTAPQLLSKSAFWELKRAQTPETEIGLLSGLTPQQARAFAQCRSQHAHTHPYFDYDTLVPGAVPALEHLLKLGTDVAVMTLRRESELTFALNQYDFGHVFAPNRRFCLKDNQVKTGDVNDKVQLMAAAIADLPASDHTWMIGDTEADMAAARSQNIPAIAVLSGIRDLAQIRLYEPDWIVPNLAAAVQVILQQVHFAAGLS
jgi:phosphoglycolate phosphatase-like HAD superfamily hydrolase